MGKDKGLLFIEEITEEKVETSIVLILTQKPVA